MKFTGFGSMPEDLSKVENSPAEKPEENASKTPEHKSEPEVPSKIDRRPKATDRGPKSEDEMIIEQTGMNMLNETGHIPNHEDVHAEALRYKFQGMPSEQFADMVYDALKDDPESARKMSDKMKEIIDIDHKLAIAKQKRVYDEAPIEDLIMAAADELFHDEKAAKEIVRRVNQSFSQKRQDGTNGNPAEKQAA